MQIIQLIKREVKVIYKRSFEIINLLAFFLVVAFTFSFSMSGAVNLQVSAAIIIVCFMLASNLSGGFIFENDIESGILQQLFLRVNSLNDLIFAKIIAQFVCFGVPLTFVIPIISIFFNISPENILMLMATICITSFLLSILNVMIAGITAGLKAGRIISVIISVPLYIPLIVMDLSFIGSIGTEDQMSIISLLENALGYSLVIIPLSVFAIRQTIRTAVEN